MSKDAKDLIWKGKVTHNKKNNQLHITLSRKKLKLKKKQIPKEVTLSLKGLKF